ncbi:MAG: hypothetical protein ACJATG_001663 [Dinoroseobacter sp.]|jgi:hypothetical protein
MASGAATEEALDRATEGAGVLWGGRMYTLKEWCLSKDSRLLVAERTNRS